MIEYRQYQENAVQSLRDSVLQGNRRIILHAPTGSGKTIIAVMVMQAAVEKGRKVLFIADRRELIHQASEKLDFAGIPLGSGHNIIMSGEEYVPVGSVQLASKDTLFSWANRRRKIPFPPADLVVVDEAHSSTAPTWQGILEQYSGAVILGLTATPAGPKGMGLGRYYKRIIKAANYRELIEKNYLVPTRVFAPTKVDTKGLPINSATGDYSLGAELNRRVAKVVGNVLQHWQKIGSDRLTIGFASSVKHSIYLRDVFRAAGVLAEHVDGKTEREERDKIVADLRQGRIKVVWNVDVFQKGIDLPAVSCCILVRPTKSLVWFRQACNRIQRPYPGKIDAILIDHTSSVLEHGFPDEDIEWPVNENETTQEIMRKVRSTSGREPIACPKCYTVRDGGAKCPSCGFQYEKRGKRLEYVQGTLGEIYPGALNKRTDKEKTWLACLGIAANRGQTISVARMIFRSKTGHYPTNIEPMPDKKDWRVKVAILYPGFRRGKR